MQIKLIIRPILMIGDRDLPTVAFFLCVLRELTRTRPYGIGNLGVTKGTRISIGA